MTSVWKLAYRNLFRNKRRSLSTGIAICVGFVALNLLAAYIYRTKRALDMASIYASQRGHYLIYKKDALDKFQSRPKAYSINKVQLDELNKKLEMFKSDIEYTGHTLTTPALLSNGVKSHPVIIFGFDTQAYEKSLQQPALKEWAQDWVLPSQYESIELFKKNSEMLSVTGRIMDIMSFRQPLAGNESVQLAARTLVGDLNAINADLGASHTTGLQFLEDTVVMLPLLKTQELMDTDGIESLSVYLNRGTDVSNFGAKLKEVLSGLSFPVEIYRFDDEKINSVHSGTMGFLYVMGSFFVLLICTAVSLTISNSLTMGIIERTREIGTLRAIGFTASDVQKLFTRESLCLCFLAMAAGTVVSFILTTFVNSLNIQFFPPGASKEIQFMLKWNLAIALMVFLLLAFITWLSAYIVISRKNRVKLISLLNDTGDES